MAREKAIINQIKGIRQNSTKRRRQDKKQPINVLITPATPNIPIGSGIGMGTTTTDRDEDNKPQAKQSKKMQNCFLVLYLPKANIHPLPY